MSRVFFDTNVFVASLTDEEQNGTIATKILNSQREFYTSLLNLMELRSVLTNKKRVELERVEDILGRIRTRVAVVSPDPDDVSRANERQAEELLYPMDALTIELAADQDAPLATFDGQLLEAGGVHPDTLLSR